MSITSDKRLQIAQASSDVGTISPITKGKFLNKHKVSLAESEILPEDKITFPGSGLGLFLLSVAPNLKFFNL